MAFGRGLAAAPQRGVPVAADAWMHWLQACASCTIPGSYSLTMNGAPLCRAAQNARGTRRDGLFAAIFKSPASFRAEGERPDPTSRRQEWVLIGRFSGWCLGLRR